jgi:hypothetical protein
MKHEMSVKKEWFQTFLPNSWNRLTVRFHNDCKRQGILWEFLKYQDSNGMTWLLCSSEMLDLFGRVLSFHVKREYKLPEGYEPRLVSNSFDGSTLIINDESGNDYFPYETFPC